MQDQILTDSSGSQQGISEQKLLGISTIIATYFLALYLFNFFQVDLVLIGVFRELLTIPALLAQIVFLIMGIVMLIKRKKSKFKNLIIVSILLLTTSSCLTIGSFFF